MAEIERSQTIKDAIKKRKEYEKQLSSTSWASALRLDVRKRQEDNKIASEISEIKKDAWYTNQEWEQKQWDTGVFGKVGKVFDKFNIPLRALVGAVESITWKGDVDGFIENVKDNVKEWGDTFGTLFEKYNMPFAKPIGFIADLTLDPLNLVWGIGVASKLGKAGKIWSAWKVLGSQLLRSVPDTLTFTGKLATGVAWAPLKIASKITKANADSLLGKAIWKIDDASNFISKMGDKVDNWTNLVADNELKKIWSSSLDYLMETSKKSALNREKINSFMENIPWVWSVWKGFKSDSENYFTKKLIETDIRNGNILDTNRLWMTLKKIKEWKSFNPEDLKKLNSITDADEALRILGKDADVANITNPNDFYKALGYEAELDQIQKTLNYEKKYKDLWVNPNKITHIKWYDDTQAKVQKALQKSPQFKAFSDFLGKASGWFKVAKLANPASILNNYMGSFGLVGMAGIDFVNKDFLSGLSRITQARYTGSGTYETIQEIMSNTDLQRLFRNQPDLMESIMGIDFSAISKFDSFGWSNKEFNEVLKKASKKNLFGKLSTEYESEIMDLFGSGDENILKVILWHAQKTGKPIYLGNNKMLTLPTDWSAVTADNIKKYISELDLSKDPIKVTKTSIESISKKLWVDLKSKRSVIDEALIRNRYDKMSQKESTIMAELTEEGKSVLQSLKDYGNSDKLWSKAVKFSARQLEKLMEWFGAPDQIFRLNTFLQMTNRWLTLREIENLAQTYKFWAWEILQKGTKYFIEPEKALDVVSDIFINYDAMPAAVKVMRNMPIFGAPFAQFTVESMKKTAKAAIRNPEFFSHMESLQNDLGGTLTPLDEATLDSEYYKYIKDGNYVKLPFFQKNPVFLNMTNYLPYYAFNNLGDNWGRGYEKWIGANVISAFDKLPIAKDPIGATIFDYFIQPLLLAWTWEDNLKGAFWQTLYPKDANAWEKTFYGARNLMEAYFPTAAGILGVPASLITGGKMSETLVPGMDRTTLEELIPSYRFRSLYNAVQGKSAIGSQTKEDPLKKTFKNLAGYLGVPVTSIDTTYTENKTKKEIKK